MTHTFGIFLCAGSNQKKTTPGQNLSHKVYSKAATFIQRQRTIFLPKMPLHIHSLPFVPLVSTTVVISTAGKVFKWERSPLCLHTVQICRECVRQDSPVENVTQFNLVSCARAKGPSFMTVPDKSSRSFCTENSCTYIYIYILL